MKTLNRRDFPGAQYPERIIQFGEGNFLRAFVDWQIDLLNEHTDLNSGVVVVRPIETSFPPSLSTQDGLYTTIIRGLNEKGEAVSDARLIRSVNREISVYSEYDEFLKLAHNPEMRFVFSNTTEAGISYHAGDKFDDAPAVSYPAKLTRLLFERFSHFNGALDKGWIIIPCELIDYNGFRNPYIKHQLLSIALNGMTKFRTRILPQLLAGQKANGTLPARLTFALAALIAFYRGVRNGETYPVQDDAHWLERYQQLWSQYRDRVIGTQELVAIVLAEKDHWEQDLTQVPGLVEQVANDLDAILEKGMREAVRPLC
ncbi:TPA: hypothetical protein ACIE7K_002153 [Escherichia coli]